MDRKCTQQYYAGSTGGCGAGVRGGPSTLKLQWHSLRPSMLLALLSSADPAAVVVSQPREVKRWHPAGKLATPTRVPLQFAIPGLQNSVDETIDTEVQDILATAPATAAPTAILPDGYSMTRPTLDPDKYRGEVEISQGRIGVPKRALYEGLRVVHRGSEGVKPNAVSFDLISACFCSALLLYCRVYLQN